MEGSVQGAEHPLMTLRQAAEHTGLSATTLRRYIKSGRLRARLIPGRYGPEYVVTDEELGAARLLAAATHAEDGLLADPTGAELAVSGNGDFVSGMLFRELLMKHEQLLVQYGMLRVGGQQVYEARQESERRAKEAEAAISELGRLRDRHAKEIGELKARLRQGELALAEKDEELRELRLRLQRAEIDARNAATAQAIDHQFQRLLTPDH